MLYHYYEMSHAAIKPARELAKTQLQFAKSGFNPFKDSYTSRYQQAQLDVFLNATRRYEKPSFDIDSVEIEGKSFKVTEKIVDEKSFCNLIHFSRSTKRKDPPVLLIAPMSGHYATLLRGTVKEMIKSSEVYVTDWLDPRDVPVSAGSFDLDDYTDYLIDHLKLLHEIHGERAHIVAVCQPGVPALVATALMAKRNDAARPASMTLMGSPIDVTKDPQAPNEFATSHSLSWFEERVISVVPWPLAGFGRRVYPGFLQLQGFLSMNMNRHTDAHMKYFRNLIKGDGDSAASHREFYDEYLAVMDLTAEFYLQTIDRVFQKCLLAKGEYYYRDELIDPSKIKDTALFTIEGERDDITGKGQTKAAHKLLKNLPADKKMHLLQPKVGHYGIFNGSRWREIIYPMLRDFIRSNR